MEASPLVQQARPSFQLKVCSLYRQLFVDDEVNYVAHAEGFWNELFTLKPEKPSLYAKLERLSADDLLHFQLESQQLFYYALRQIKSGTAPSDERALETLVVFFNSILAKRYTNPNSDIITMLAGLDQVDTVFSEFANTIEVVIRTGRTPSLRESAVHSVLSLASGAYQTSLVSYFTHRDLFPALAKYIQDSENVSRILAPFVLLGILANYNKFEHRNPYRLRMADFVNETTILQCQDGLGETCKELRNGYAMVQPDTPEPWNFSSALSSIGLGILAPIKAMAPAASEDLAKKQFSYLPGPPAATLLGFYDFVSANKLFCQLLLFTSHESKGKESPFNAFLSLTSYILHHAYRSSRASMYGLLNLITLRVIANDDDSCQRICNNDEAFSVRFCRQRQPFLPPDQGRRAAAAHILDIAIDAINHNLQRRLDVPFYVSCLHLIHRILSYLACTRTQLRYHWSFLWQSLLSFIRFLVTYEVNLKDVIDLDCLITPLLKAISLSVVAGNSFLNPAAYDDLIYKLVEMSEYLSRFTNAYNLAGTTSTTSHPNRGPVPPIEVLIYVTAHYNGLLGAEKAKGRAEKSLLPSQVNKIIRQGYESLDLPSLEAGLDTWEPWREGEERGFIKRVGRMVVEDVRNLVRHV